MEKIYFKYCPIIYTLVSFYHTVGPKLIILLFALSPHRHGFMVTTFHFPLQVTYSLYGLV